MPRFIARFARLFALAAALFIACSAGPAQALVVGATDQLCVGPSSTANPTNCVAPSPVQPFTPIYYAQTLNPTGGGTGNVTLIEQYAFTGFNFVSAQCVDVGTGNLVLSIVGGTGTPLGTVPLVSGQQVVCLINGYFSIPGASASNTMTVIGDNNVQLNQQGVTETVTTSPVLPNDLSIVKTETPALLNLSNGPDTAHYTITLTNNGLTPLWLGPIFELTDTLALPPNGVPVQATLGAITCTNSTSSNPLDCPTHLLAPAPPLTVPSITPVQFFKLGFPAGSAGYLGPQGVITLKYDVSVSRLLVCAKQAGGDGLKNNAFFDLVYHVNSTTSYTVTEQNPGNNTTPLLTSDVAINTGAYIFDPNCTLPPVNAPPPVVTLKKTQTSPTGTGPFSWGTPITYVLTINNTSSSPISNVSVQDYFWEGPGMPPFGVTVNSAVCSVTCTGAVTTAQNLWGYYVSAQIWHGMIPTLPPGISTVTITVQLTPPVCDSFDAGQPNLAGNIGWLSYSATVLVNGNPTLVTYNITDAVNTPMQTVAACHFQVTKNWVSGNPLVFGVPMNFKVTYQNLDTAPRTVGTLIDAMRIVPPNYATQLSIAYNFQCTTSSGVSGFVPNSPGYPVLVPGSIVHTTYPSQGVRLINNPSPVTFPAGATLTCNVSVKVSQPPAGDAYCLSSIQPQVENLGLMDISRTYNSNLIWPPSGAYNSTLPVPAAQPSVPTNWATVAVDAPKCYHPVVNKSVSPTVTWPGGPTLNYTITLLNQGDLLTGGPGWILWNGLLLIDTFTPNYLPGPVTSPCVPSSSTSTTAQCKWLGTSPNLNPFGYGVQQLAHNASISVSFPLLGPYIPGSIDNCVQVGMISNAQWYVYDQTTLSDCVHVPVLPVNKLLIRKQVVNNSGLTLTNSYPVTVQCGPPVNTTQNYSLSNGGSQTLVVPVGTICTVTENTASLPVPTCGKPLQGVWTQVSPQTITIAASPALNLVTINNRFDCVPPATSLQVSKKAEYLPGIPIPNPLPQFPLTVSCTPGPSTTITLVGGAPAQTIGGVQPGSNCLINETIPPVPLNYPPNCKWIGIVIFDGVSYVNPLQIASMPLLPKPHTVDLFNYLDCLKHTSVSLTKKAVDKSPIPMPNPLPTFPVNVTCTGGPNTNVVLTSGASPQAVTGISIGSNCTITETVPVVTSPPQCKWVTTIFLNGVPKANGSQILNIPSSPNPYPVTVENDYVC